MGTLNGFRDGDDVTVGFVSVGTGDCLDKPQVLVSVRPCTVFSAEHDLVRDASGVSRVWMVDSVHHSEAEAHAWVAKTLRSLAAAIEAGAAKHAAEAIRLGVGEAVPA